MKTTFGKLKIGEKFCIGIIKGKYEKCKEFYWKPGQLVNCFIRRGIKKGYWYVKENQEVEKNVCNL